MGKVELGAKLTCDSCGARFYDLNKTPAKCPKCGAANSRPVVFKARRSSPTPEDKRPVAPKPVEDVVDDVAADVADDEDEAVIEDTSDLGEDDDAVEVVVDNDN